MGTALDTPSTLDRTGLSREQLLHFAEHGWVMLEGAIAPELCQAVREAAERLTGRLAGGRTEDPTDRGNVLSHPEPHLHEAVFYDLYLTPGLLAAARQLIGHDHIRYIRSIMTIVDPDPDRETLPEVITNRRNWGWHRCFYPKHIISPHDTDPELIHTSMLTAALYLVPVAPEHGVTAFFDRSHRYENAWARSEEIYDGLSDRFEIVQPTAAVGSIVLFSESTFHSTAPVLSGQRRFANFLWLAVPWFNRFGPEPHLRARFVDDDLRELFAPCETADPDA